MRDPFLFGSFDTRVGLLIVIYLFYMMVFLSWEQKEQILLRWQALVYQFLLGSLFRAHYFNRSM
ncbi:hypothetical protein Hanom_Chr16g01476881 [Helianthus anomalus]